jgi:hypothetical protein
VITRFGGLTMRLLTQLGEVFTILSGFTHFYPRHDLFNCELVREHAPAHSRFTQSCFYPHHLIFLRRSVAW